jgi:hypothetical protein
MTKVVKHPETELIEIFHEFLDSIYYEGYAEHIAENMPNLYAYEKEQFISNHAPCAAKVIPLNQINSQAK